MRRSAPALVAMVVVIVCGGTAAAWSHSSVRSFMPAPHRKPPDLETHGWIPKPLRIIAFVPAGYPHATELRDWPQAIVASTWLRKLEQAYHVPTLIPPTGQGFIINDMPVLPGHDAKTTDVFNLWVDVEFAALRIPERPDLQTVIILFDHCTPPESLDGFGCTSHHPNYDAAGDSYALSLGNPTGSLDSQRDALTSTASHELAEAITDAKGGWHLTAVNKDEPWAFVSTPTPLDPEHGLTSTADATPWVEDEDLGTIESADESTGARWHESFTPAGFRKPVRYAYIRVFANAANDHGDDPAVPASPDPYFNVTTTSDWYFLHLGATKLVTATGWSSAKLPKWKVVASLARWSNSRANGIIPGAPDPCRLKGSTSTSVENGNSFTLKVGTTSNASAGKWCLVKFTSLGTDPNGDSSHPWYVGFILEK